MILCMVISFEITDYVFLTYKMCIQNYWYCNHSPLCGVSSFGICLFFYFGASFCQSYIKSYGILRGCSRIKTDCLCGACCRR